jgi:replicative DNA helicase
MDIEDDPPARSDADESGCADPERCGISSLCDVCKAAARQRCDRDHRDGCPFSADKPKCFPCAARTRRQNVLGHVPDIKPKDNAPSQLAAQPTKPESGGYHPKLETSKEFFNRVIKREFLIRNVLVKDQSGVVGGGKKTLKSSIGVDMAISLATGTPFLGHFQVPQPVRVLLINGESGEGTLQETGRRIAAARGISPESTNIVWGSKLPQLANILHLRDLAAILKAEGIGVLMIDPTYMCLLAGVGPDARQASNLFDMGEIYSRFAERCLEVGTTPNLFSHMKKDRTREPPDLDDLAFAGIAEFARQWTLLSRREPYEGDGFHELWLSIGGSAGHSSLSHLDIDEGALDDNFSGRKWEVTVTPYNQAKSLKKSEKEQAKAAQNMADDLAVAKTIDQLRSAGKPATITRIRKGQDFSRDRTDKALARLCQDRTFEEVETSAASGKGGMQAATVYRRVET